MLVKDVTVVFIYLSQDVKLVEVLNHLKNFVTNRTIILGDVNFYPDSSNLLTRQLKLWKFSQLVEEPTHDKGNIIDHVYVSEDLLHRATCDLHYVYYSDHQVVCVNIL